MKKFEFIFLIISSDDLTCYLGMREFIKKYFILYEDKIKYFFIELSDDLDCEICEKNDYIYVKGHECITPGVYIKTMKSMNYVNENYDYDFLIRTNVSSFWNLKNLFDLKPVLPLNNFAGGIILSYPNINDFITGTGIILSKDVCINLSKTITIVNEFEDVYIGQLLVQLGYILTNISDYTTWKLLINNVNNNIDFLSEKDIKNTLYYRIKNIDRNIDLILFDLLYKKIYLEFEISKISI